MLAFRPVGDFKLNHLSFIQGLETIPLNRRIVDKDVLARLQFDETVAFLIIEPLHLPLRHSLSPPFYFDFRAFGFRPPLRVPPSWRNRSNRRSASWIRSSGTTRANRT